MRKKFGAIGPHIVLGALILSGPVLANTYQMVVPMKGLSVTDVAEEIPKGPDVSWQQFATDNGLAYEAGWNSIDWDNQGLNNIPDQSFPNPEPSGNILLSQNNIQNLSGLRNLRRVGGWFYLTLNPIVDFQGLESLTYTDGFYAYGMSKLTSSTGVSSLTEVNAVFVLRQTALSEVDGFSSLVKVGNNLWLNENQNLTNLNGLSSLSYIGSSFYLRDNPSLVDLSGIRNVNFLKNAIYIDVGIQSRQGFVPIPATAWLCQSAQAVRFPGGYAQQSEVCE